jgi:hypothetical protein
MHQARTLTISKVLKDFEKDIQLSEKHYKISLFNCIFWVVFGTISVKKLVKGAYYMYSNIFQSFIYYQVPRISRKTVFCVSWKVASDKESHVLHSRRDILSGFRHNSSQKTCKRCVSHVLEHISIIHSLSSSKNKSKNCFFVSPEKLF